MIIQPAPSERRWILAALMMTMALAAIDTTVVSTAVPQVVSDLGGLSAISLVFSVYLLAQTVTIPIYGKFADTFGRKPVLAVGTLIFLLGSVLCAFAWDMASLIAFRALQGLGAGAIMATVNTLAGDLYGIKERAAVQGWLSSVWGVAAIVGPTLGGALATYVSWRWIFLINLPFGAASLYLISRFLKEKPSRTRHRIDYLGAILLLLTSSLLIFGLSEGGHRWPWLSLPSALILGGSLILIALTIYVEKRAQEPIMPGWVWGKRLFAGPNLAAIGMGIVMMGPNTYLPTYGQAVLGLGGITAGLLLASSSLGWPFASSMSGRFYLRLGFRDASLIGATIIALAALSFIFFPVGGSLPLSVVSQVLLGVGFGFLSTPLLVGIQASVPFERRGVVTSSNVFARNLGQSLGAAMAGALFNHAIHARLEGASDTLRQAVPNALDSLLSTLDSSQPQGEVSDFLRTSVNYAMKDVYLGMTIVAGAIILVLLWTPRHFPPSPTPPPSTDPN